MAAAVVALWIVLLGHCAMLHSEAHAPHQPHPLASSVGGEFAVDVDHAHLVNGSVTECHDVFATAVLPRSATALVELGVVAAVIAVTVVLANLVVPAGRGRRECLPLLLTGRDLLTRFCLARR